MALLKYLTLKQHNQGRDTTISELPDASGPLANENAQVDLSLLPT